MKRTIRIVPVALAGIGAANVAASVCGVSPWLGVPVCIVLMLAVVTGGTL